MEKEKEKEKENKSDYSYFEKSFNERFQMVDQLNEGQKSQEDESKKEEEGNKRESLSFAPIGKFNYINIINIYYREHI